MEKDHETNENGENISGQEDRLSRRDFFTGLGKWSLVVIGAALGGSALLALEREASGGGWANRGGGGGGWANRGGGGGGGWANRAGGGGAWANRAGGGGGAWVNRF